MNTWKRFSNYSAPGKASILALAFSSLLPFSALPQQNHKLSVAPPSQVVVKRGGTTMALVTVTTLPEFHVNSNKPKDEFLIPFQLTWSSGPFETSSVEYPKAEQVQVGTDQLSVFTGTFTVKTEIKAPLSAPTGATVLLGKLHYQACNNRMCFRPETLEVKLPVLVE